MAKTQLMQLHSSRQHILHWAYRCHTAPTVPQLTGNHAQMYIGILLQPCQSHGHLPPSRKLSMLPVAIQLPTQQTLLHLLPGLTIMRRRQLDCIDI